MSDDATIAAERINMLHDRARKASREGDFDRSREYVRLAQRLAQRQRLSLPQHFDRFVCNGCDVYLLPGRNARVRTQEGHVVVTCDCGTQMRYSYDH